MVSATEAKSTQSVRNMEDFLQKRDGAVAVQERRRSKIEKLYPPVFTPFGSLESDRQEVQRLQKAQTEYGAYACITETQHTYEEAIQSLVGLDLRRQYEARRQRNHTSSPKAAQNHQGEKVGKRI